MARRTKNFNQNTVSLEMADTWLRIDISKADAFEEDPIQHQKIDRCLAVEVSYVPVDVDAGEGEEGDFHVIAAFHLEHVGILTLDSRENSWLVTTMWDEA